MLLSVHRGFHAGGWDHVVAGHDGDVLQVEHLVVQLDTHHGLGDLVEVRISHPLPAVGNRL